MVDEAEETPKARKAKCPPCPPTVEELRADLKEGDRCLVCDCKVTSVVLDRLASLV